MKPKSAHGKGRLLENFIVSWLRNKKIDPKAIRTPGSGSGRFKGDIYTPNLPIVIECKNTKTTKINEWIAQAEEQTMGYTDWAIIWHPPRKPLEDSVAIIPLHVLEKLFRKL